MKFGMILVGCFIIHIKAKDVYKDIANDVEKRFDTSSYKVNRPWPVRKNKRLIWLMKDELVGRLWQNLLHLHRNILLFNGGW